MVKSSTIYFWTCCYCGFAGMQVNTTPTCVNCSVRRCRNCRTEAHKIRLGDKKLKGHTTAHTNEAEQVIEELQQTSPHSQGRERISLDINNLSNRQNDATDTGDAAISDAETVISTASSTATLVDPGAIESFSRHILAFQSLRSLWPQLIKLCGTRKKAIHIIGRLMQRFAKDLSLVSRGMLDTKRSDFELCVAAARFVGKSRIQIARRIWEAQTQVLYELGSDDINHASDIEKNGLQGDEDDNGIADDDLMFELLERFLFDSGPISSLQANIKLLIKIHYPTKRTGHTNGISRFLNVFIENTISAIYEPPLPMRLTRLRYTCVSLTFSNSDLFCVFISFQEVEMIPCKDADLLVKIEEMWAQTV